MYIRLSLRKRNAICSYLQKKNTGMEGFVSVHPQQTTVNMVACSLPVNLCLYFQE
ncbi:hypothetical protein [Xanthocytophaga agilis]|uniref:Uncharacterized protein n=1 Tax=Xanthocytophaga agilis TaxID=3048010 RepID=A0AAE3QZY5_9BACT|nr:hypothetical protein [Xanthocytophaga agilis]MDJ1501141.1 hypothetical protein [Xanthocytophaga agilis]